MMSSAWIFRWLCICFVFVLSHVHYTTAVWPSSNDSTVQILGVLYHKMNINQPDADSLQTRAMFLAAILLSHQYNVTIGGQFIGWRLVKSEGDVIDTQSDTCLQISTSNIAGIVGPAFSRECQVIAPFAEKLGIPVVSYGSTDPDLSDRKSYPTFYRTVPADNAAALAITKLFMRFNWASCIVIHQNDAFGSGGAKVITDLFVMNKLAVAETLVFDIATRTIRGDLKSVLTSSSTRIVVLWAESRYASLILQNALDSGVFGGQFIWILSANVALNSFDQKWHDKFIGMLTVEPVVGSVADAPTNTTLLNAAYNIWQKYEPQSFPGLDNVNNYALFVFDATWSLIRSLQQLCPTTTSYLSFLNTSFCFNRRFLNSSSLLDIMNSQAFLGVSGPVEFSTEVTDRINGTYYVVKNVQSLSDRLQYVPVLVSSDSGDWTSHTQKNTIIWPGKSLIPPTGFAAISGLTLRIAVIESAPFTMITEVMDVYGQTTKRIKGYIPDLIRHLEKKMGFIADIIPVPANYTYNGLIDAVANGVYDMVVGDMTIIAVRREKVGFSNAIFENELRIIMRDTATVKIDYLFYFRPFSRNLWIVVMSAFVLSVILIWVFERNQNPALIGQPIIHQIGMCMWFCLGTMVGYGVDFHVKTAAGRVVTSGLYVLAFVLIAAYTANLASILTISKSQTVISGIDDITNGKIPFSRIGILANTAVEAFYLREVSGGVRNFYPLKSNEDIFNALVNNYIDAAINDGGISEYLISAVYCNLTLVGAPFDRSAFGIVFPKDWLYQQVLDVNILSLRESGILDSLKNKWFQTSYCSRLSETPSELSMESMTSLFITFGFIVVLSLILLVWLKRSYIIDNLPKLTRGRGVSSGRDSIEAPSDRPILVSHIA